jgi:hypothetical protein
MITNLPTKREWKSMQNAKSADFDNLARPSQSGQPDKSQLRDSSWWYSQYIQAGLETGAFSVYKVSAWARAKGYLSPEERAPSDRTLERWCSAEKWVEKRGEDLKELAERAEISIREGLSLRKAIRYQEFQKHLDALSHQLNSYLNVFEEFDGEQWVEREDTFSVETRLTRTRLRLPSEFGRASGNVYTYTGLQRIVSSIEKAQATLQRLRPQTLAEREPDEGKTRLVMKVMPDERIAEMRAALDESIEKARAKVE